MTGSYSVTTARSSYDLDACESRASPLPSRTDQIPGCPLPVRPRAGALRAGGLPQIARFAGSGGGKAMLLVALVSLDSDAFSFDLDGGLRLTFVGSESDNAFGNRIHDVEAGVEAVADTRRAAFQAIHFPVIRRAVDSHAAVHLRQTRTDPDGLDFSLEYEIVQRLEQDVGLLKDRETRRCFLVRHEVTLAERQNVQSNEVVSDLAGRDRHA